MCTIFEYFYAELSTTEELLKNILTFKKKLSILSLLNLMLLAMFGRYDMSNRKKYNEKLRKIEVLRKRRLKKKLRRNKILAGRRKNEMNQPVPAGRPGAPTG